MSDSDTFFQDQRIRARWMNTLWALNLVVCAAIFIGLNLKASYWILIPLCVLHSATLGGGFHFYLRHGSELKRWLNSKEGRGSW